LTRAHTAPAPPTALAPALTLKDDHSLAKNASSLCMLSRYHIAYYCAHCQRWVPKERALLDRSGAPRCPKCGFRLRTRPLRKRWET